MIFIPGVLSFLPSFSVSLMLSFGLGATFVSPAPFSFSASACLVFAVDDLVTLPSLDIGVGRVLPFVALVRVTPLGPAPVVLERNLEVLVDFTVGSLEGPGAGSLILPFPFSSGTVAALDAGGGTGVRFTASGSGGSVDGGNSDESCSSGSCGFDIVGATGRTSSGFGAGSFEASEVDGISGYGSTDIGGSTETDLNREARWEGGVGDLEGSRKDSGFGCGGMRCEDCWVIIGLGSRFGSSRTSDRGGGGGEGVGVSMLMGSAGAWVSGRSEVDGKSSLSGSKELRGVRGDIDPRTDRVFCTGVFCSA